MKNPNKFRLQIKRCGMGKRYNYTFCWWILSNKH